MAVSKSDFLVFIQSIVPEARRKTPNVIIMPKQDLIDFIELLELEGASKYKKEWAPVSKKIAAKIFQDPEVEGMYFMKVTLEEVQYEFCVYPDGCQIDEI